MMYFVPRIIHLPCFNPHLFDQSDSLHTLGCTLLLRTFLFTIANIYKQPNCPSVDEWVKQLWDI